MSNTSDTPWGLLRFVRLAAVVESIIVPPDAHTTSSAQRGGVGNAYEVTGIRDSVTHAFK